MIYWCWIDDRHYNTKLKDEWVNGWEMSESSETPGEEVFFFFFFYLFLRDFIFKKTLFEKLQY